MRIRPALLRAALSLAAALLLFAGTAFAATIGVGTVMNGPLRLREEPSTASRILANVPKKASVAVLAEQTDGWYHVTYEGKTGYLAAEYLAVSIGADAAALPDSPSFSLAVGTVTHGPLRLRKEANTSSSILANVPKNASVVVLEDGGSGWYKVSYGGKTGYMSAEFVSVVPSAEVKLGYGRVDVDGSALNLRESAGTDGKVLAKIPDDTAVELLGLLNDWYKITYNSKTGYVSSDYIELVDKASATSSAARAASSAAASAAQNTAYTAPADSSGGSEIVAYAKEFLGCKYVYGGNGPKTFDCSGFTKYVMKHFGYNINRTASQQLKNGSAVAYKDLQPGDLVFFKNNTSKAASHVGIYIGGGQFIHASTTNYKVKIDTLSSGWYYKIYTGARRIA